MKAFKIALNNKLPCVVNSTFKLASESYCCTQPDTRQKRIQTLDEPALKIQVFISSTVGRSCTETCWNHDNNNRYLPRGNSC